jgi:hypothetical protein
VFKHIEILIWKDGVHARHIKTSIRHVNTGFVHDNMTFWNNKTVFRQVSTTFWQEKMNIWHNKTSLRQVLIKRWQANTSIIHNKMLLVKNKTKCNNMRQLWRSIANSIYRACLHCPDVRTGRALKLVTMANHLVLAGGVLNR